VAHQFDGLSKRFMPPSQPFESFVNCHYLYFKCIRSTDYRPKADAPLEKSGAGGGD
jgi:hypothetical protein